MSTVRVINSKTPHTVMGEVEERIMTVIACDIEGVPQPEEIGKRHTIRRVHFAYRGEAFAWMEAHERDGWEVSGPTPCATSFFGDTDSDSNCWACEAEKEILRAE